jgi:PAS domain S-box-containing protein
MLGYDSGAQLVAEPPGLWARLHVDPARRAAYLAEMHGNGEVHGFESQLRRRDGRLIWVAENAKAVVNVSGECTHCEAFVEDITARKEAEQLKSDFIGFVTHQLRTPLAGIRWMLELAGQDPSLSGDVKTDISDAHASALRLIGLVNELLDISRLENGRLTNAPAPTDLGALAQSVLDDLAPLIQQKGQRVDVDATAVPPAMVDPQLARQAVLNFLSNAVKYTPPGGTITVSARLDRDHVRWSVTDTGIGIPAAAQKRLFEKFFRAENATTVNTEGTGLGLYFARLIAERSGGSVTCTSIEGEGSTFSLALPIAQPVGAAA